MFLLYSTFTFFHLVIGQGIVSDPSSNLNCKFPNQIDFCIDESYDQSLLPPLEQPLQVNISCFVEEVTTVNDLTMTITLRLNLDMSWRDSRIKRLESNPPYVVISPEIAETLFIPDLYVYDLVRYRPLEILDQYEGLWLSSEGALKFYIEGLFEVACTMRFDKYPIDNQVCKFYLGSTVHNNKQMVFDTNSSWFELHIYKQRPLQHTVDLIELKGNHDIQFGTGNYSRVGFKLYLRRKYESHILQIYMPSGMFVFVSWISFILPYDGGERVSLLVTLLLVLVSMFLSVVNSSPKAYTLTGMESWVFSCMVFVFIAVLEFGFIIHLVSRATEQSVSDTYTQQSGGGTANLPTTPQIRRPTEKRRIARKIDRKAIIILPCLFTVFNMLYWFYFLDFVTDEIFRDKASERRKENELKQIYNASLLT